MLARLDGVRMYLHPRWSASLPPEVFGEVSPRRATFPSALFSSESSRWSLSHGKERRSYQGVEGPLSAGYLSNVFARKHL